MTLLDEIVASYRAIESRTAKHYNFVSDASVVQDMLNFMERVPDAEKHSNYFSLLSMKCFTKVASNVLEGKVTRQIIRDPFQREHIKWLCRFTKAAIEKIESGRYLEEERNYDHRDIEKMRGHLYGYSSYFLNKLANSLEIEEREEQTYWLTLSFEDKLRSAQLSERLEPRKSALEYLFAGLAGRELFTRTKDAKYRDQAKNCLRRFCSYYGKKPEHGLTRLNIGVLNFLQYTNKKEKKLHVEPAQKTRKPYRKEKYRQEFLREL